MSENGSILSYHLLVRDINSFGVFLTHAILGISYNLITVLFNLHQLYLIDFRDYVSRIAYILVAKKKDKIGEVS